MVSGSKLTVRQRVALGLAAVSAIQLFLSRQVYCLPYQQLPLPHHHSQGSRDLSLAVIHDMLLPGPDSLDFWCRAWFSSRAASRSTLLVLCSCLLLCVSSCLHQVATCPNSRCLGFRVECVNFVCPPAFIRLLPAPTARAPSASR